MRYLLTNLSALWPEAMRRRSRRTRRYARPGPALPSVATGPIPVILPSARTGTAAPPLPSRPVLPWETPEPAVDLDVVRRAKVDRLAVGQPGRHARPARTVRPARSLTSQHTGMIRLLALAHHQDAERQGVAA